MLTIYRRRFSQPSFFLISSKVCLCLVFQPCRAPVSSYNVVALVAFLVGRETYQAHHTRQSVSQQTDDGSHQH